MSWRIAIALLCACGKSSGGGETAPLETAPQTLKTAAGVVTVTGPLPKWEKTGDAVLVARGKSGPDATFQVMAWLGHPDEQPKATAARVVKVLTDGHAAPDGSRIESPAIAQALAETAPGTWTFAETWADSATAYVFVGHPVPDSPTIAGHLFGFQCAITVHGSYANRWQDVAKLCTALVMTP